MISTRYKTGHGCVTEALEVMSRPVMFNYAILCLCLLHVVWYSMLVETRYFRIQNHVRRRRIAISDFIACTSIEKKT